MDRVYKCTLSQLMTGFRDWKLEEDTLAERQQELQTEEALARGLAATTKMVAVTGALLIIFIAALLVGPGINEVAKALSSGVNATSSFESIVSLGLVLILFIVLIWVSLKCLFGWGVGLLRALKVVYSKVAQCSKLPRAWCLRGYEIQNGLRSPFRSLT